MRSATCVAFSPSGSPMSDPDDALSLHPDHLADLRRSGLSDETIRIARIRSLGPGELPRYLGHGLATKVKHAYLIPYADAEMDAEAFYRIKLFPAVLEGNGHHMRYYQPPGTVPRLFRPTGIRTVLVDPSRPLFVTEGEKKALKAHQEGVACVAFGGLWSWRLDGQPLPDLDPVDWSDRETFLVPDSDVWTRPDLLRAVYALGKELETRGAKVNVVKLPAGPGGQKVGLDDYLCTHSTEQLNALSESSLSLKHATFSRITEWWKGWRKRKSPGASSDANGNAPQGKSIILADPEPWPEPVKGDELLNEITRTVQRFVVLPDDAAGIAIALWTVQAHAHEAGEVSPILAVTSPLKRCGKTTLFGIMSALVPRLLSTANITPSALFRTIERFKPTLLIDEADTFLGLSDEMRGLLNAGHARQTAWVVRGVGDEHEPRKFSTWCPKAIALIGRLPDTLADRAIEIPMRRRGKGERVERFRMRILRDLEPLCRQAARWAKDHLAALQEADPQVPEELDDRAADNWRPLLSIADLVGDEWSARAREAARRVSGGERRVDGSAQVQLLADISELFDKRNTDRIASAELVEDLVGLEERPWNDWGKRGKPLSQRQLADLLKPFEIAPKVIRIGTTTARGYERSQFEDAFSRYLQAFDPKHPQQDNDDADLDAKNDPKQEADVTDRKCEPSIYKESDVTDVTDQDPKKRRIYEF